MEKVVRGGGRAEPRREHVGMASDRDSKNLSGNSLFAFGIAKLSNHDSGEIPPSTVSGGINEIWVPFELLDVVERLQTVRWKYRDRDTQRSPAYASSTGIG
jgi:hypothetical protein